MNKIQKIRLDLNAQIENYLETDSDNSLTNYLVENSNLPGRRANLELAHAFAKVAADKAGDSSEEIWRLCLQMTKISETAAPVDDPREFLPFCGTCGIGAIGAVLPLYFRPALKRLKALANDPRWRMREAVCFGGQALFASFSSFVMEELLRWPGNENWLQMRAAAAMVADPAILMNKNVANSAFQLHQKIINRLLKAVNRRTENFRVLRKALGFTLSVIVQADPQRGFAWMNQLCEVNNRDLKWILKQNLKKSRLVKHYPEDVARLQRKLASEG